ncbi:flavodoxin domain-containing protein [Roseiflexus castenholzii]|jgi:menaquinone-dependent protoporphyrinogen oxidase|uniref:Flavodoxin-like protein n=1 Tax=Roseiflexus castenholzii (strain DSM 13941 / HLO8) TaxID=383372 RepID=A7NM17_ROSCS|nr:flavodoxin domain-containing protein [Roseiflexus castenholzii]ABU58572.1 flavodoxin-like protein [Roseiflexus castenholzii DSM 13941]
MSRTSSRRRFLKAAGIGLAATTVACIGGGYVATRAPESAVVDLTFAEESTMSRRILVTYATRAGSTAEIAAAIARTLGDRGFAVDGKPIKARPEITGYDAIIIGSAIRMGCWLPEAVDFVKANQATLNSVPVALFTVHMLNTGDDETSRANRAAYLDAVRPLIHPAAEAYFAGAMNFARLSFLDRLIARMVGAVEEDRRDWAAIAAWAERVPVAA